MLHDLRLQLIASTPHSSSLKHLWSLRASGTWQALSTFWSPSPELKLIAGQTCRDIALACLTCFSFCTSKYLILKNGSPILIQEQILHNTIQLQFRKNSNWIVQFELIISEMWNFLMESGTIIGFEKGMFPQQWNIVHGERHKKDLDVSPVRRDVCLWKLIMPST